MRRYPPRLILICLLTLGAAGLGLFQPETPDDPVDFSLPPPEDLLFFKNRTQELTLTGEVNAGDLGIQKFKQTLTYREDSSNRIREVRGGRPVLVSRNFYKADTTKEIETDKMLTPWKDQQPQPYSQLDILMAWKEGEMRFQVLEEHEDHPEGKWIEPRGAAVRAIETIQHTFLYPDPLLFSGIKRVGESWSLTKEAINNLFARAPADPFSGTCKVTFSTMKRDHATPLLLLGLTDEIIRKESVEIPCAVLTSEASLETNPDRKPPMILVFKGEHYYSLEHRIIVFAKISGEVRIKGSIREYDFDGKGTLEDLTEVAICKKEDPAGNKEKPEDGKE